MLHEDIEDIDLGGTEWTVILRMSSKAADILSLFGCSVNREDSSENIACQFHDKAGLIKALY